MSLSIILAISLVILIGLAFVVYSWPDAPKSKSKKQRKEQSKEPVRNWEEIAKRFERQVGGLNKKVEQLENDLVNANSQIDTKAQEAKQLLDKLSQEKKWREKEQTYVDKGKKKTDTLEAELKKAQDDFSQEHSLRLRIERELKNSNATSAILTKEKSGLSQSILELEKTVKEFRKNTKELIVENKSLKKKKDDESWVAKSDYKDLEQKYKELEKRLNSQNK